MILIKRYRVVGLERSGQRTTRMIICSCNVISDRQIEAAVEELVSSDADAVVTLDTVYRAMGWQPKCGTCLQAVVDHIHEHRESLREGGPAGAAEDRETPLS